jgi:heptosyltransferase-2
MSQSDVKNRNTFLVIQTASIGDVILATPVVEKLHFHYPQAKIDFLLKQGNESLFENHPFINKVLTWNKHKGKYSDFFRLIGLVKKNKYDCVINIQRFGSTGLITALSGAGYKTGFSKNPFSVFYNNRVKHTIRHGASHEISRNLDLIKNITDDQQFSVKLYPGLNHFEKILQFKTGKFITISPASLWFTKQYPEEKWVEFIRSIPDFIRIYFLGSKKDFDLCQRIINESQHHNSMNLCGNLSFLESAALMKDALMNFMNDSAPLHLASAVNAATTAIFCSTVPEFGFGPLADNSIIVQTHEQLQCRPCGLHGYKKCPKKHFKCATSIDVNDLIKRLE